MMHMSSSSSSSFMFVRASSPSLSASPLRNRRPLDNGKGVPTTDLYTTPKPAWRKKTASPNNSNTIQKHAQLSTVATTKTATTSKSRRFTMIRILFITYYGSLGSLMPYLPVYFHSLGHSGSAIGLLGAVKPLTTFIVAPLWGMLADSYQNPNFVLQLTFISSLVLQLLLPLKDDVKYLVGMVFITALFNAPVKSLLDSMVMDKLSEEDRKEYGKLRLWGQLGFGMGSGMVGCAISKSAALAVKAASSMPEAIPTTPAPAARKVMRGAMEVAIEAGASAATSEEMTKTAMETISEMVSSSLKNLWNVQGFKLAFLAYGIMSIPAFLSMKAFQRLEGSSVQDASDKKSAKTISKDNGPKPSPRILKGLSMLLQNRDAMLFFFLVFLVGTTSGIIENFAYVRIREVGGTGKEMGLCRLVSSLAGAPMFWFSGPLTEALGADRVLVLSLVSYIFRFLNYAFIKNPFYALPAEALRGVTFAAFWSTGTVFAHKISPPGMSATMLLFMNAMYGGLGQSTGAIIGGKLQSKVGTVKTFIYSAAVDFVFVCFLSVYLHFRKDGSFKDPKPIVSSIE